MAALKVTREEAHDLLRSHAKEGEELAEDLGANNFNELYEWRRDRDRWVKRVVAVLEHIYEGTAAVTEFEGEAYGSVGGGTLQQMIHRDYQHAQNAANVLISLSERLPYDTEPGAKGPTYQPTPPADAEIFLVHGRDLDKRNSIARFLERSGPEGFRPTILDEQAGKGRTIVEKLEQHAGDATYAVVLLTGDDVGRLAGESADQDQPRARQNVILELGLFTGKLGRTRVAVLYEPGVEIPSDIGGLEYIALNSDWEKRLVRELVDAGWDFSIDRLNR